MMIWCTFIVFHRRNSQICLILGNLIKHGFEAEMRQHWFDFLIDIWKHVPLFKQLNEYFQAAKTNVPALKDICISWNSGFDFILVCIVSTTWLPGHTDTSLGLCKDILHWLFRGIWIISWVCQIHAASGLHS